MALSLLPTGISLLAGGVDGLLRQNDANNGRTEIHKEYSTYYEGGIFAGGAVMGMFDVHPDLYEPLLYVGGGLLASKFGQWAMAQANSSSSSSSGSTTTSISTSTSSGGGPGLGSTGIRYGQYRDEPAGIL